MAVTIELTPEIKDQLALILIDRFKTISESLSKEITEKAIATANKKTELTVKETIQKGGFFTPIKKFLEKTEKEKRDYDVKQRFKESGLFGLTKDLLTSFKQKPEKETKKDDTSLIGSIQKIVTQQKPKEQDLIKEEQAPTKVLIDGITDIGYRDLSEKLPDILKGVFDKFKTGEKEKTDEKFSGGGLLSLLGPGVLGLLKGALLGGGGIALLLGGIAALITGLQTEGPWKGTLKLLSRFGLEGGLALLKKGAAKFIENGKLVTEKILENINKLKEIFPKTLEFFGKVKNLLLKPFNFLKEMGKGLLDKMLGVVDKPVKILKETAENLITKVKGFIDIPMNFLKNIGESVMGIFGKGSVAGKSMGIVGKALSGAKGIFGKMLAGIGKIFTTGFLKRIPIIGTVIGLSFAYTRFKSGDTVGGIIDVLSAIASIIPGAGTAISIGLDVLNAFLDHKAGGSTAEASKTKMGMVGDFFGKIYDYIAEKLSSAFNWVVELGKKVISGNWGEAFVEVAKFVPAMGWVVDLMGGEEVVTTAGNVAGSTTVNFLKGVKDWVFEKITNALGWIGEIGKKWMDGKVGDVIVDICKTIPFMGWVVDLMGGEEKVTEVGNTVGGKIVDFRNLIKDTIMGKLKPIFGLFSDIGEKFENDDPLGGIGLLCKVIPGLGWIGDILNSDTTKMKFNENMESGNIIKSITGVFEDISKSIMQMFLDNALYMIPDTILGFPLRALVAQKLGMKVPPGTTTKIENTKENLWLASTMAEKVGYNEKEAATSANPTSKEQPQTTPEAPKAPSANPTSKEQPQTTPTTPKELATGGIVTQPLNAIVGEAGPEAVIPLDKYMSPEGFKISNDLLGAIANNTGKSNDTNFLDAIANNTAKSNDTTKLLAQAILKLADVFDKKPQSNNVIVANQQTQQQQYPTASQVAATNVDPIRQIRMQFAV